MMKFRLVLLMLWVSFFKQIVGIPPTFQKPGITTTGKATIVPLGGLRANTTHSFIIRFTGITGNPQFTAIGIVGFDTPITSSFSFNLTIITFNTTTIQCKLQVYEDMRLNKLVINYIHSAAAGYLQHHYQCFLCTILNANSGVRIEPKQRTTNFTFGRLYFHSFFSGFKLTNTKGLQAYLEVQTNQIPYSNTLRSLFKTDEYNIISEICYYVLVFNSDQIIQDNHYNRIGYVGTQSLSNITTAHYLDFGRMMDKFQINESMFFGISGFRLSQSKDRIFNLDTESYVFLGLKNYLSNSGTTQIIMGFFLSVKRTNCTTAGYVYDYKNDDCIPPTDCNATVSLFITNVSSGAIPNTQSCGPCHYTCMTCANTYQCLTCNAAHLRFFSTPNCNCRDGYFDNKYDQHCQSCLNYINGCKTCSITNYTVRCSVCNFGSVVNNKCQCSSTNKYFINQNLCINTTGCIGYIEINSTTAQCTLCDTANNYDSLSANFTCVCKTGYKISGQSCILKCGDGVIDAGQQCDDKNTVSGDGCSSTCQVQIGWTCSYNISLSLSVCTTQSSNSSSSILPTLKIGYVRRVNNANTMRVAVLVTPQNLSFLSSVLKSMISHNVPVSDFTVTYADGNILIDFYYNLTIEGKTFTLNMTPYPNRTVSLSILASGMNSMLTYDTYATQTEVLQTLVWIIDFLALLIMFFSVFRERMIGVEMIQTFQSVFFAMAFMKKRPNPLSPLQQLQYVNGYNMYAFSDYSRIYPQDSSVASLGLDKQFLLSFNIMFGIVISCFVLVFMIKVLLVRINKKVKEQGISKEEIIQNLKISNKMNHALNFAFQKILFIVIFFVFFTVIFATETQMREMVTLYYTFPPELNVLVAILALFTVIMYINLVILNYAFPNQHIFKFRNILPIYLPFYTIYQTFFIAFTAFLSESTPIIFILLAMVIANIITLIILKPYNHPKHNYAIVFHQFVIALSLICYIVALMQSQNQIIYLIFCYFIVILLYVVLIWNTYRLWKWNPEPEERKIDKHQKEQYLQLKTGKMAEAQPNEEKARKNTNNIKSDGLEWIYYDDEQLFGIKANHENANLPIE